jgi:hypothetical protein
MRGVYERRVREECMRGVYERRVREACMRGVYERSIQFTCVSKSSVAPAVSLLFKRAKTPPTDESVGACPALLAAPPAPAAPPAAPPAPAAPAAAPAVSMSCALVSAKEVHLNEPTGSDW